MKRAALCLLLLSASLWAAPAVAQDSPSQQPKKVRLIYHPGFDFGTSCDLLSALERVLSSDSAHIRIQKITNTRGYYSNGNFLYDLPKDLRSSDLETMRSTSIASGETAVIDEPKDVLFVSTGTSYPLLDRIFGLAKDLSDEVAFSPGARRLPARIARATLPDGRGFSTLRVSDKLPGPRWRGTMAVTYDLLVDSKPVTVIAIGKPVGGPDRGEVLVSNRLREIKEPVVLFSIGDVSMPPGFNVAADATLKKLDGSDYRFLAFSPFDMEIQWEALLAHARLPGAKTGIPLLCTNLKSTGPGPSPIESVHVEDIQGVKVGFLSLIPLDSAEILARKKAHFEVQDPVDAAKDAIKELRVRRKVDVVVAVSHLDSEEDLAIFQQVWGIDIYLESFTHDVASRRKVTIDLIDWNREWHGTKPLLRANAPYASYGELALSFHTADDRNELTRIEELPGPTDPDAGVEAGSSDFGEVVLSRFLATREALLPDPRTLWPQAQPPKLDYDPPEFWNLSAQLLRRELKTETAFLRIQRLNSNGTGVVTEGYISQWLSPEQHVVTARLPGSAIKALMKRFSLAPIPVPEDFQERYDSRDVLAGAGMDKKQRIGRIPISDDELYTVATTQELLQRTSEIPELKSATDVKPDGRTLSEVVLGALKARKDDLASGTPPGGPAGRPDYKNELRGHFEGKTPPSLVWRVDLSQLSLQLSNTNVENNRELTQVPDARIQAQGQLLAQGSARLVSELYWGNLRWNSGVTADYGQVTIRQPGAPSVTNVTEDQLVFETELNHRSLYLEKSQTSLGPFVNISYNTEFTRPPDTPRAEIMLYKGGLEFFDGTRLKQLYAGPAAQTDYAFPRPNTQLGYAAGITWDSTLPHTPVELKAQTSYLEFFPSSSETAADLRRELDVNVKLSSPFLGKMKLSPFLDYFLFEGAVVHETGYSFLLGVSFDYSQLWKPYY